TVSTRRKGRPPPIPHRPSDWALSHAALARRAMIASRASSLAAESETNAATARCRPSGRVIMPKSLVAEDHWLAPASPGSPHITKELRFALLCSHHNDIMGTLS